MSVELKEQEGRAPPDLGPTPLEVGSEFDRAELPPEPAQDTETRPLPVLPICAAGALAAIAPAWLVGGFFRGYEARVIAIGAVLVGASLVYLSVRFARSWLQYLLFPAGLVLGAVLVAPFAKAGTGSLPSLVGDALRSGGILQPPIDLEPGWRLILTTIFVMLGGGSGALAVALEKPRVAAALPVPIALGAAIVQPPGSEVTSALVATVLVVAALAVSYGADLTREGPITGSFERVRLLRSGGLVAGLVAAVFILNQFGFLFPGSTRERVDPPTRPRLPPPVPDVPLFTVKMDQKVPLRLGVIDVYQDGAFLLPPNDTRRLERLKAPTSLARTDKAEPPPANPPDKTFMVEVKVAQATGHLLPDVAWATRLTGLDLPFLYDPRTNTLRVAGRPLFEGLRYTLTAGTPPDGAALGRSGPAPEQAKQYLEAPEVPLEVKAVLDEAPEGRFDRLQYVRKALYEQVIAAGRGRPTDVSAQRVVQMLKGAEANSYEITAAEALLARWAGIPSRIGYGYFGGAEKGSGTYEIRPINGATWLEAYFSGYGWQPIVGTPPRARASLTQKQKNPDVQIQAVDQFGLVVYLPARVHTLLPLFVVVRYYLVRALPLALLMTTLLIVYPGFVKAVRRRRRRSWARGLGLLRQVGAAYAEFRDRARDLAIGDPLATPLEFLDEIEPDDEHEELAWLVTRTMWGDYRAEVSPEVAAQAERTAASVTRRLTKGQDFTTRLLAFIARTSLRDPYTLEVPNLWWRQKLRSSIAARLARLRPRWPRLRLRPVPPTAVLLLLLLLGLTACDSPESPLVSRPLATRLVPEELGGFSFKPEPTAEEVYMKGKRDPDLIVNEGRVFTLRYNQLLEGAVQFARFKPGYRSGDPAVTAGIRSTIGGFKRLGGKGKLPIWVTQVPDQRIYLWFPADSDAMALLVLRNQVGSQTADALARALVAYGRGEEPESGPLVVPASPAPAPSPSSPDLTPVTGGQP